jgi:hypothetical protein
MNEQKHKGENFTKRRRERRFGKEETSGYCDDSENKDFKCVAAAALNIQFSLSSSSSSSSSVVPTLLLFISETNSSQIEIGSNRLGGRERTKRRPRGFKRGRGRRTGLNVKECKKNV